MIEPLVICGDLTAFVWGKQMSYTDGDISVLPNVPRWTWDKRLVAMGGMGQT